MLAHPARSRCPSGRKRTQPAQPSHSSPSRRARRRSAGPSACGAPAARLLPASLPRLLPAVSLDLMLPRLAASLFCCDSDASPPSGVSVSLPAKLKGWAKCGSWKGPRRSKGRAKEQTGSTATYHGCPLPWQARGVRPFSRVAALRSVAIPVGTG